MLKLGKEQGMNRVAEKILKHKIAVMVCFAIAVLLCLVLMRLVNVNFNMVDYLPDDSPSTVALDVMNNAFDDAPTNARILLSDVSVPEALAYKERIKALQGIEAITWLDDEVDIHQPLGMIPQKLLNSWYKDSNALFAVLIANGEDGSSADETIEQLRSIIGSKGAMAGDIVNIAMARESTDVEISGMVVILVPLILLILILTTSSWFEPVLFIVSIGVSVLINMGTNAFLGEVSFVTQSAAAILQLAVSMDYSIFLLHRFAEFRCEGCDVKTAMGKAMTKSFSSILASGLTTIIGFAALIIMRFKIGPDMGIVLAKGIVFSLLSVMLLLPVLTIATYKIIDKTHHRSFLPSFKGFARLVARCAVPVFVLVALVIVPAFLAQRQNYFTYGSSVMTSNKNSQAGKEEAKIEGLFGKSNFMVLLFPSGSLAKEKELTHALYEIEAVGSIVSYPTSVGIQIPSAFLPEDKLSSLVSKGYSRMVLTVSTSQESPKAFETVKEVRSTAKAFYGEHYYLAGGSVNVMDMRDTVIEDNKLVMLVSIIAIGLVILLTFRSLTLPLLLLITIETSIWINLSFPYFSAQSLAYIGYMIISSVQLGATVDYAILLGNRYLENRQAMPKREALLRTVSDTTGSILTSAAILTSSGFVMGLVSTNGVVGELGMLLGRGAALSAGMVLFLLPPLLVLCDKLIQKTTMGLSFYKEGLK